MGFAQDSGYLPASIETIISDIRVQLNTQFGTSYTVENFVGTNWYKFVYAVAQRIQKNEIKASETFVYLQQYFTQTNARIQRPVATAPGIIEALQTAGFVASVKAANNTDAGKVFIAVDVDNMAVDYATKKLAIATIIKDSVVAGNPTQGTEVQNIVLSNGQNFDFKYKLPNKITVQLRLTLTLSDSNKYVIEAPEVIKQKLIDNIQAKYRLGLDFEPQRYFTTVDAPWTAKVLLEWSNDAGATWEDDIFEANYDDLFVISLANITLVEV